MENSGTQQVSTREDALLRHQGERQKRMAQYKEFLFQLERARRVCNSISVMFGSHGFGNHKSELVHLVVVNKYRRFLTPPRRGHLSIVKSDV